MGLQYTTDDGVTLVRPGAYAQVQVVSTPSSVAANGILMVIGEADSGPDFTQEADLNENGFGPDQQADIIAKYGSGQLVDAFTGAVDASNDPNIQGSFTKFIPVKTNVGVMSTSTLPTIGGGTYANIVAVSGGSAGNLITRTVTVSQAEVPPSTGPFILASPQISTEVSSRVNGGLVSTSASVSAGTTPSVMVSDLAGLSGTTTTGGVARGVINTSRTVSVGNIVGYSCTFTITTASTYWAVNPTVGDILIIGSGFTTTQNEGTYVVQAVSTNSITALKVIDASGTGIIRSAPQVEAGVSVTSSSLEAYSPVTISVTSAPVVPGLGKSLELANTTTGNFADIAWVYSNNTLSQATFVSQSSAPYVITSSAEYEVDLNVALQSNGVSENWIAGGTPVLSIGYLGSTAQAVINVDVMVVTLTGGASASLSPITVSLANYPTLGALCQFFNSLGGFTAAPTLATYSSINSQSLDDGTYNFGTVFGAMTGRIKNDGSEFMNEVNSGSALVNIMPTSPTATLIGLPDVASLGFLSGGARGGTTNATIQAGLDALQGVVGNLLVPLFSQGSVLDIANGTTDPSSSYDINSINTACRAHVLYCSQLKRRKRRIAVLSIRDTFANAQNAAANMAQARCCMTMQDPTDNNAFGTLTKFYPWMTAIKAAAMQAAGFYKDITQKYITVSAAVNNAGGYNYNLDSDVEAALDAGLLVISKDTSGFYWESDQTTYSADDSNFVYNSLQAMYVADLIASTAEQRMQKAFVGQSLADVNATVAVTVFGAIMDDIRRLKLIAPSDDAIRGFKNVVIKILNGDVMIVSAEVKEATSLKFIAITFMVTPIQQTATG